ncbi:hypothetical protein A2U01_0082046, partial [Trifolium medium]|nr:hypothetical protein [Trifolium medium]
MYTTTGAARRRQNQYVPSKQIWRAAQHPWARRAATRNHQKLQFKHFELVMAPLEPIPTKPNLKQHSH